MMSECELEKERRERERPVDVVLCAHFRDKREQSCLKLKKGRVFNEALCRKWDTVMLTSTVNRRNGIE